MAWPPTLPTGTRNNATPQLDTHPNDHNMIADALDEIVTRLSNLAQTGHVTPPAAGGNVTYIETTITFPKPFATPPVVTLTVDHALGATPFVAIVVPTTTTTTATIRLFRADGQQIAPGTGNVRVAWIAVDVLP